MMRVRELATDLRVGTDMLLHFLRESGVRVGHADAPVADADVAKIRTRLERERRSGGGDAAAIMEAAVQGRKPVSRRRRRKRRRAPRVEVRESQEGAAAEEAQAPGDESGDAPSTVPDAEAKEAEPGEVSLPAGADTPSETQPATVLATESETDEPDAQPSAEEVGSQVAPVEVPGTGREAAAVDAVGTDVSQADSSQPEVSSGGDSSRETASTPKRKLRSARDGVPAGRQRPAATPLEPAASAGPGGRVRIQAEGYTADGRRKRAKKKGGRRRGANRDKAKQNMQRVMAEIKGGRKKRKRGKGAVAAEQEKLAEVHKQEAAKSAQEARTVRVNEYLTVAELAEIVDVSPTDLISWAFKNMSIMVTINQRLDFDQIELLLEGFGFKALKEEDYQPIVEVVEEDDPADLRPRPPVVTVMGHVDHGKTKLLDWIRNTNVVAGEAGGITQHIGAYHVEFDDGRTISFLDTPGHAAFSAMRARGAEVTDLVVLVVAADDSIMRQTREAISHARTAGVPIVVAINKCDLPAADADRVKRDLLQAEVTVEDFGGDVLVAEVSAKTGSGMDDLLEKVLLQAELLELQANPSRDAVGAVVEAQLDVGKGPVATILVQNGTLRVGDCFVVGTCDGRVRALLDERGHSVDAVGPGIPVQVLGASSLPQAGDVLQVMDADQAAATANHRQRLDREKKIRIKQHGIKLGDFTKLLATGDVQALRLVVKGDVDGSVQALCDSLEQLSTDEVRVEIVHRSVGAINESDVMLALASKAFILGFRVRPDAGARRTAARDGIDVQVHDVIYEAVDEVRLALEGLLAPERRESVLGVAEARVIFKIRGVGTIAGSYVTSGMIRRGALARVIRDGVVIYESEVGSLRRFKEDAREVKEGFECGIGIANFNDVKVGDVVETFHVQELARTLPGAEARSTAGAAKAP